MNGLTPVITGTDGAVTKDAVRFGLAGLTVLSGLVIYEVSRIVRARSGVRLEASFAEIPVE